MHARDDVEKILLTWKLLHVGGKGKKGRHLVIVIVIIIVILMVIVITVNVTIMSRQMMM